MITEKFIAELSMLAFVLSTRKKDDGGTIFTELLIDP